MPIVIIVLKTPKYNIKLHKLYRKLILAFFNKNLKDKLELMQSYYF